MLARGDSRRRDIEEHNRYRTAGGGAQFTPVGIPREPEPVESRHLIDGPIVPQRGKSDDDDAIALLAERNPRESPNKRTKGGDAMREAERMGDRICLQGADEDIDGETGMTAAISPQYPATMGGEPGIQALLKTWKFVRKSREQEDEPPQSAASISLSVSEVETAVLEGMQLANSTVPDQV